MPPKEPEQADIAAAADHSRAVHPVGHVHVVPDETGIGSFANHSLDRVFERGLQFRGKPVGVGTDKDRTGSPHRAEDLRPRFFGPALNFKFFRGEPLLDDIAERLGMMRVSVAVPALGCVEVDGVNLRPKSH